MSQKRRDNKGRVLKNGESQRKNGSYAYRYKDSRNREQWIYAKSLNDLREKEKEVQKLLLTGTDYAGGNITVLCLVEKYIQLRIGVRENTIKNYNFVLNLLKRYDFSVKKINKVKPSEAKAFFIHLNRNEGYAYSTVVSIRGVLKPAFDMAVEDGLITRNPFSFSVSSVVPNEQTEKRALSEEQIKTYLDYVASDKCRRRWYDEIVILLETGMRVSELYGLTSNDIDLKNRRISVNKQLQRNKSGKLYIEKPKTKNGERCIPMSGKAVEVFTRVMNNRKRPAVETIVDGYAGFLFLDLYDKPKVAMHLEHAMKRILTSYNESHAVQLPPITPHTFRHTFISRMYANGMKAKNLQELVGHADIQTTLGIYTHTTYEQMEQEFLRIVSI